MDEHIAVADIIASVVLARFDSLPSKCKPLIDNDNGRGWTVLCGIVVKKDEDFTCVSLATGMKCLPTQKVEQSHGLVLHDSHAEILALRGLNNFLLQECRRLAFRKINASPYIRWQDEDKRCASEGVEYFTIREDLELHMYCSEAPCGDSSMELTMAMQEDSTAWTLTASPVVDNSRLGILKGRGYFSELGTVRRKPSRADCPQSLSKSCSDKLALKQCTSLLSSTSILISPENAYLHSLVLPLSQYVKSACDRAFSTGGRMNAVADEHWVGGFSFRPFQIKTVSREFAFSRRWVCTTGKMLKGSNVSAVWTPDFQETIINGVLQGRKQGDPRGASVVSRIRTWRVLSDICKQLSISLYTLFTSGSTYSDFKSIASLSQRETVKARVRKEALRGWIQNVEDNFDLSNPS